MSFRHPALEQAEAYQLTAAGIYDPTTMLRIYPALYRISNTGTIILYLMFFRE
jgi:hypothetical protein